MILYYNESRIKTKTRVEDKDYIDYNNGKDDDKFKFIYFDDTYKDKSESS